MKPHRLHGLSRAQRLAWLGNMIEWNAAADRARLNRWGRSGQTAADEFDPHAATEIAHLIERVLFPDGAEAAP